MSLPCLFFPLPWLRRYGAGAFKWCVDGPFAATLIKQFGLRFGKPLAQEQFRPVVSRLRAVGFHVRHSYRATTNVGKLLGEASRAGARWAVILGDELEKGTVAVKDLASGEQREVAVEKLEEVLRER